jgi:hypothetical protein
VVVIAAAGAGVAVALTGSGSHSASVVAADVTESVRAAPNGTVTVTWTDVSHLHGFQTYLLLQNGKPTPTQPIPPATTITLDRVPPGESCFRVGAAFQGSLPAGLPHANRGGECVTVP